MYNKSLTVIYTPGSGGEFFSWLIGQHENVCPSNLYMQSNNRWNIIGPEFFHLDPTAFNNHEYCTHRLNVLREHDHALFHHSCDTDEFLRTRYDIWDESLIILMFPHSEKGTDFVNKNVLKKLSHLESYIENHMQKDRKLMLKKASKILDKRKYIPLDPYDLFYNTNETVFLLNRHLKKFEVELDVDMCNMFVETWRRNNDKET
ncbi:hypothetical protein N8072_01580 [bacterium]|nr:hypothetical protein [bacterium]MDB4128725.1 hypothetical protein [bacterium]MDC1257345.1 hypothetical protein [bacterium]